MTRENYCGLVPYDARMFGLGFAAQMRRPGAVGAAPAVTGPTKEAR